MQREVKRYYQAPPHMLADEAPTPGEMDALHDAVGWKKMTHWEKVLFITAGF